MCWPAIKEGQLPLSCEGWPGTEDYSGCAKHLLHKCSDMHWAEWLVYEDQGERTPPVCPPWTTG